MFMIEEDYINCENVYENWNWKKECFIIKCNYCGNIWVSTCIERCICCDSGDINPVPFRNHSCFSLHWLRSHGFPFIERVLDDGV